jgi:AhpD family alkylhydroperoxidase
MEQAMDRLEDIARKRQQAHAKLRSLKSKVYEAFLHLEEVAFADGVLPKKTKELIAVGISVTSDCESCMQWHIEQAAAAGATLREASGRGWHRDGWRSRREGCGSSSVVSSVPNSSITARSVDGLRCYGTSIASARSSSVMRRYSVEGPPRSGCSIGGFAANPILLANSEG